MFHQVKKSGCRLNWKKASKATVLMPTNIKRIELQTKNRLSEKNKNADFLVSLATLKAIICRLLSHIICQIS